ncbi:MULTISPECIES: tetratricopeptide repeat protein [Phyllobacteriaceae]|uniref:Tetratricopeptide repeat protein n=1 Tax=Mesorhizobium hungaricum TaxID=1566387 RepID=A0A1C2ECP3_9HYPH|nr:MULTISPECIES: tetratricopeptide repeat protein [Mesorhizobium]MBN9237481.1 tetratricopeptide repeat protein [Mesorhizobium sp.]MDQ0329008.1 tetratricopeptide (TPR) repeat protein [Mesorhizobium sp. YL-MeA3-2017]OCX24726.1 hypothetical protein QV13_01525 [Mesorhizobium hungaricum]
MQKRLLIHAAAALVSLPFLVAQVYAAGESGGSGGGTSGGASSGGGGSAETTAKCKKKGEVYDTKSKKCVLPKQGMLDDNNIYQAGHDLAMAGRYDEAIAVLTLAENKKDPRILNYLGYSHRKSGRVVVGLGYYEEALRQNPDYTLVREYLGEARLQMGDIIGARAQLGEIEKRTGKTSREYGMLSEQIEHYERS